MADTDTTAVAADSDLQAADSTARWPTASLLWSPWTIVVGMIGLATRVWVISTERGFLLADEAYTGLQAQEVLDGEFRIIIPGLAYTAPFDSYLIAPVTALTGQSLWVLKLYPSLAWAVTAVVVVAITRRLATDRAAVLAGSMIWIAPGALGVLATRGFQSYASGMATVAAATLAALLLLEAAGDDDDGRATAWRSALVGALAGFAFYLHPMYGAVLFPLVAVPAWRLRRQFVTWWVPAVAGAVAVNLPFLLWNLRNDWPSLTQPAEATDGPIDRFVRFFTELVPRAYGLRGLAGDDIFGAVGTVAGMVVLVAATVFGAVALWQRSRHRALVVLVPLTAGWFLMAGFTNTSFVLDGRYAIITFPFVVMAMASGLDRLAPKRRGVTHALVAVWLVVFSVPLLANDTGFDSDDPNAAFREAVDILESNGIDRVIGYYWWVLPLEFLSDQEIRSATTGNPAVVLLPNTQRLVEGSPPPEIAFVFWSMEEDTNRLLMPLSCYERVPIADAVMYLPRCD